MYIDVCYMETSVNIQQGFLVSILRRDCIIPFFEEVCWKRVLRLSLLHIGYLRSGLKRYAHPLSKHICKIRICVCNFVNPREILVNCRTWRYFTKFKQEVNNFGHKEHLSRPHMKCKFFLKPKNYITFNSLFDTFRVKDSVFTLIYCWGKKKNENRCFYVWNILRNYVEMVFPLSIGLKYVFWKLIR